MSAIRKLTPWCIAIGTSKVTRSFAYSTASSYAAWATPTAPAAVPGRVKSRVFIAILKPSPSSPSRFSAGTTTSVSANAEVSVARWPILSRCFSSWTPGVSMGTTNADIPRWPLLGSVFANTTVQAARPAFVMKVFDPFRTYSSPRRSAVVFMRATSEPASGSLSPKEQRIGSSRSGGSHSSFCASVPAMSTGAAPSPFARIEVAIPEQPQLSSSPTSIPSNAGRPARPATPGGGGS